MGRIRPRPSSLSLFLPLPRNYLLPRPSSVPEGGKKLKGRNKKAKKRESETAAYKNIKANEQRQGGERRRQKKGNAAAFQSMRSSRRYSKAVCRLPRLASSTLSQKFLSLNSIGPTCTTKTTIPWHSQRVCASEIFQEVYYVSRHQRFNSVGSLNYYCRSIAEEILRQYQLYVVSELTECIIDQTS